MGKPTGFMDYERETAKAESPLTRIKHFNEFHTPLSKAKQREQGGRCMACGVPFCQAGMMIGGMASGCPLNSLVPEWNDLVYNDCYEQAYDRLMKTHCFPEFTSRVCPALCEKACTCNLNALCVGSMECKLYIAVFLYFHALGNGDKATVGTTVCIGLTNQFAMRIVKKQSMLSQSLIFKNFFKRNC